MASLRDNPVSNFVLGAPIQGQPGVGGVRDSSHPLQQDPISGLWFDPQTGTSYYDNQGTQIVTDPNVAQQVATNAARAQGFLGAIQPFRDTQLGVLGNETNLGQHFQDIIMGRTPSLAAMQQQQAFNTIAQQQLSQAAGVSGAASPLAQLAAMRNTGSAQIGASNAAAEARVKEQMDASNAYAALLAAQGHLATNAADQNITGATNFANLAAQGQAGQQGADAAAAAANAASAEKFGYSIVKSATAGAGGDSGGIGGITGGAKAGEGEDEGDGGKSAAQNIGALAALA